MAPAQVSDCALTSLRLQESGALAAVGAADGSVTLLRLCDGLVDMQPAEKQSLAAVRPPPRHRHGQPCRSGWPDNLSAHDDAAKRMTPAAGQALASCSV